MECLDPGGWREAEKLFHIYKSRFEVWLEVLGEALSGLRGACDRVKTALSHFAPF